MLWDSDLPIQEYTDTHVYTTIYDQGSFEPVARLAWLRNDIPKVANDEPENDEGWYGNNKPEPPAAIQIYHYHNDQLGTPNELTNDKGEVVWLADYEAWGNTAKIIYTPVKINQIQVSQNEIQPIRFQGQHFDEETGLHYNRFRYYDPDMGMFTTRDPIGLIGGDNVFQYAPNPTGWIDPLGLEVSIANAAKKAGKFGRGIPGILLQAIKPTTMGDATYYPTEAQMEDVRAKAKTKADDRPCTSGDCERDKNDCKKRLSDWQIKDRGLDPHDLKHGILGKKAQVSLYELCKCKDNSIVIRHKNCKGPIIPTWEYY